MAKITLFMIIFLVVVTTEAAAGRRSRGGNAAGRRSSSTTTTTSTTPRQSFPLLNHAESRGLLRSSSSSFPETFPEDDEYFDGEEIKPHSYEHQCENIRIEICHDVGYNVTSMPNFVGHEVQMDAEMQLQSFLPLISFGCSSQLKFFLCSVYVPMCTEKVPVMIGPCRPLCESVRSRCAPVLLELGFQWPAALNCSKFVPENTIDHMCMDGPPPHESERQPAPVMINPDQPPIYHHHHPPPPPPEYPPVISSGGGNHRRPLPPIIDDDDHNNHVIPPTTKSPSPAILSRQCSNYRNSENYVFLEHPRPRCVAQCTANILFSGDNKNFVDYWTVVWSSLAAGSCLITIVMFLGGQQQQQQQQQFRYPERAIFYISLCYMATAMAYIYRALIGRTETSCYQDDATGQWLLVQEGAHNPHCTITFLLLYYFGMAGASWWLVLAITWSMMIAANNTRNGNCFSEKLSQYDQLYHTMAWTLPAIQTLAALVTRAVEADELTGICYVGAQDDQNLLRFVIWPMSIYLGTGITAIILSFLSVRFGWFSSGCCGCCGGCYPSTSVDETTIVDSSDASTTADDIHVAESTTTVDSAVLVDHGCGTDIFRPSRQQQHQQHRSSIRRSNGIVPGNSGHPVLLSGPGGNVIIQNNNNNFCSTVSSTSSSYSSGSSKTNNHRHSNFRNLQQRFQYQIDTNQKDAALVRSGIFALFYTIPALSVLAIYIYEYSNREQWLLLSSKNIGTVTKEPVDAHRANFELFNMRLFMSLVVGIKTGIWILTARSPFTFTGLRCIFNRWWCRTKPNHHNHHSAVVVFPPPSSGTRRIPGGATVFNPQQFHHHHPNNFFMSEVGINNKPPVTPEILAATTTTTMSTTLSSNKSSTIAPVGVHPALILENPIIYNHHHHHQQQQQQRHLHHHPHRSGTGNETAV